MDAKVHACIGGTNVREDMARLAEGVHVVVGTPGRVNDMINRQALKVDTLRMFCLDEADEMLSRGFKEQVCLGLGLLPLHTIIKDLLRLLLGPNLELFSSLFRSTTSS